MGLITKGIKYGAVALAARHAGKQSAAGQNVQQQQAIVNEANTILAQQAQEHQQEQQNLVDQANQIIATQQAEHEQELEKLKKEQMMHQQQNMYPSQQQCLPAPPPQHPYASAPGTPAPGTPYSQSSTPGTLYRDVNGYQHQGWCNLQCEQSCNGTSTMGYGGQPGYTGPAPYQQQPVCQTQPYQAYH